MSLSGPHSLLVRKYIIQFFLIIDPDLARNTVRAVTRFGLLRLPPPHSAEAGIQVIVNNFITVTLIAAHCFLASPPLWPARRPRIRCHRSRPASEDQSVRAASRSKSWILEPDLSSKPITQEFESKRSIEYELLPLRGGNGR